MEKTICKAREYSDFRVIPKTNNPITDIKYATWYFIG